MVGELKGSERLVWLEWQDPQDCEAEPHQPQRELGLPFQVRWEPQEVLSGGGM